MHASLRRLGSGPTQCRRFSDSSALRWRCDCTSKEDRLVSCSKRVQHFGEKRACWTVREETIEGIVVECVETKTSPDLDAGRRPELKSGELFVPTPLL